MLHINTFSFQGKCVVGAPKLIGFIRGFTAMNIAKAVINNGMFTSAELSAGRSLPTCITSVKGNRMVLLTIRRCF